MLGFGIAGGSGDDCSKRGWLVGIARRRGAVDIAETDAEVGDVDEDGRAPPASAAVAAASEMTTLRRFTVVFPP